MAVLDRATLKSDITGDQPNNTAQAISAADVRVNLINMMDSLVMNNGETLQAIEGAVRTRVPVVDVTGTSKTLVLSEANSQLHCSNVAAQTVTIPTNAAQAFEIGDGFELYQLGNGTLTVQAAAGVTLNGASAGSIAAPAQFRRILLRNVGVDAWVAE